METSYTGESHSYKEAPTSISMFTYKDSREWTQW